MSRILACLIFLPALVGWIIFAPSFRFGNWFARKLNLKDFERYSQWFWFGVEATDHENRYEVYDE